MPSDVVSLLQSLVRIPSVNPDSAPDPRNADPSAITGEAAMADFVQKFLENIGYLVTQDEVKPGRANVIGRAPYAGEGEDTRPRILLGPHLDTVTVQGMTIEPFAAEISDGKIHGRGTSDTKGPMAAMLQALSNSKDTLAQLPVAIDFVGFMGEEAFQHGSKHFGKHYASHYVFALAGEPTSLDIVHVTKGSLWVTVRTTGRAAHASQPELGDNAILKLTRALDIMDQKLTQQLANYQHPILGKTSINFGTIKGGTIPNIVPENASAQLDIRTTPSVTKEGGALKLLKKFISENNLPLTINSPDPEENPAMETPADHPWIQKMQLANPTSKAVGAPWFSDAAHLCNAGIPSICIGPGNIAQAHTKDEFISIDDLENGVTYFQNFIQSLANE